MRLQLTRESVAVAASLAGVAISIYLTVLHFAGGAPACPASGGTINCEAVLTSAYSVIPGTGIPTAAAGIVWFAVSAVLWLRPFGRLQLAWSALGLFSVLVLVFVEIVLIGAICLWCTAAHILILVIFLIAISELSRQQEA